MGFDYLFISHSESHVKLRSGYSVGVGGGELSFVVVHFDCSLSSGSFMTMNFELDQDHGLRPGVPGLLSASKTQSAPNPGLLFII